MMFSHLLEQMSTFFLLRILFSHCWIILDDQMHHEEFVSRNPSEVRVPTFHKFKDISWVWNYLTLPFHHSLLYDVRIILYQAYVVVYFISRKYWIGATHLTDQISNRWIQRMEVKEVETMLDYMKDGSCNRFLVEYLISKDVNHELYSCSRFGWPQDQET